MFATNKMVQLTKESDKIYSKKFYEIEPWYLPHKFTVQAYQAKCSSLFAPSISGEEKKVLLNRHQGPVS